MVICLVALTDVIFAVDSIPAIFAITSDPFIVLTSNVFAILGLRAMYFLLAGGGQQVPPAQLRPGGDPGLHRHQDVLIDIFKIPVAVSLGVVVASWRSP
jgi:tellurite resistance protein TerC